jgi:hypothetical protein
MASHSGDYSASRENPANDLLSTQLQRHLFSAFLAELDSTANSQLNSLIHKPTTSLHFTQLNCLGTSLYSLGAVSTAKIAMGGCLVID